MSQYKKFRQKISDCFKELTTLGIICRHNYSISASCGVSEIINTYGTDINYIFYHGQENLRMKEGQKECYLQHNISSEKVTKVLEILRRYGSIWDGDNTKAIIIPAPE